MSMPRQIIPGATSMVTVRTHDRRWRLVPVRVVNNLFKYLLARSAARHGIDVHVFITLSNHYHILCTDPRGVVPDFTRDLNALMARALNTIQSRRDSVWSGDGPNYTRCVTPEDALGKAAYILLNAVEAGAVRHLKDWPGAKSALDGCMRPPEICKRPEFFFNQKSEANPATIPLVLKPIPGFEADGVEGLIERLRERVAADGARHRARHDTMEWRYPSIRSIQRRSIDHKSKTFEPFGQLNPTIAAKDTDTRVAELTGLVRFREHYAEALETLLSSPEGMVRFPYGTFARRTDPRVLIARA